MLSAASFLEDALWAPWVRCTHHEVSGSIATKWCVECNGQETVAIGKEPLRKDGRHTEMV